MIEQHDLDRVRFRSERPMTSGANALAIQPEIARRQLRLVEKVSPIMEPTQIQDFLKRKLQIITTQESPDALARKKALEGNPDIGRFIEQEMDPNRPWSAFVQFIAVKEHVLADGRIVKKWAGFSESHPRGVGARMERTIFNKVAGFNESDIESWNGVEEGELLAASKPVTDVQQQLHLIDILVDAAEEVITTTHAEVEHPFVRHFLKLQPARKAFLDKAKKDMLAVLLDPNPTGKCALDPEYDGSGVYVLGGIIEDGVWFGPDTQGKLIPIKSVITNEPTLKWISSGEYRINNTKGDLFIMHASSTEDVSPCGGADDGNKKRGCSEIFAQSEGLPTQKSIIERDAFAQTIGIIGSIQASNPESFSSHRTGYSGGGGGRYERETCSTCGQYKNEKDECKCSKKH